MEMDDDIQAGPEFEALRDEDGNGAIGIMVGSAEELVVVLVPLGPAGMGKGGRLQRREDEFSQAGIPFRERGGLRLEQPRQAGYPPPSYDARRRLPLSRSLTVRRNSLPE